MCTLLTTGSAFMRASRAAVVRFFPLARSAFHTAWTSSSCLLALTASWYSGRWSKVQPGPKFFLEQVRASMPGWSAQEARKGGTPVGLGTFTHEVGMRSHEGSYASPRGTTILRELAGCNITFRPQIWTTSFFFVTSSASETPYFVGNPIQPKLIKLPAIKMTLISRLI